MSAAVADPPSDPIGGGVFVAVVGPSGAGKDTLLAAAREALGNDPYFLFVRRVVTRTSDGASEDHDTLCEEDFAAAERTGAFALSWRAHGLSYGLPAAVDAFVERGGTAVANVSRAMVPTLRRRYAAVVVVNVTAPPDVLARRIAGRGRESEAEAGARLARSAKADLTPEGAITVENAGTVAEGAARLVAVIRGKP